MHYKQHQCGNTVTPNELNSWMRCYTDKLVVVFLFVSALHNTDRMSPFMESVFEISTSLPQWLLNSFTLNVSYNVYSNVCVWLTWDELITKGRSAAMRLANSRGYSRPISLCGDGTRIRSRLGSLAKCLKRTQDEKEKKETVLHYFRRIKSTFFT